MAKYEKFFIDALETNDIKEIRNAIILYVIKDAADVHGELRSAVKLVESRGIDLWEPHKELEDSRPKSQWDEYYIGLLQSDLKYNFSKERLTFILKVANHVYANERYVKEAQRNSAPQSTHSYLKLGEQPGPTKGADMSEWYDQGSTDMKKGYEKKKGKRPKEKRGILQRLFGITSEDVNNKR